jgi:hypothetical protein
MSKWKIFFSSAKYIEGISFFLYVVKLNITCSAKYYLVLSSTHVILVDNRVPEQSHLGMQHEPITIVEET